LCFDLVQSACFNRSAPEETHPRSARKCGASPRWRSTRQPVFARFRLSFDTNPTGLR
jgi:hypothetical protein